MSPPRIEVQTSPGCPNEEKALALVREVARAMAPEAAVDHRLLTDETEAVALGFRGSPTVLVDDRDIAGAPPARTGFT